jgi:cytochrome P450
VLVTAFGRQFAMMEMQLVLAMAAKRFQLQRVLAILSPIPRTSTW